MVLTVSFVLFPVTGLFCHRHSRNRFRKLSASVGAPEPHDFAVRISAARQRVAKASIASHPNVRDDRDTPLQGDGTAKVIVLIWVCGEAESFSADDWTGQIALIWLDKIGGS